jgi:hypothetical protein
VEMLLSAGESESSVAIDNQLKVFESYERGLLATWETPAELICVPRYILATAPLISITASSDVR